MEKFKVGQKVIFRGCFDLQGIKHGEIKGMKVLRVKDGRVTAFKNRTIINSKSEDFAREDHCFECGADLGPDGLPSTAPGCPTCKHKMKSPDGEVSEEWKDE